MTIISDSKLTDEQAKSVNFRGGDLLIRGVAGSGKSVVLMCRALNLNKKANAEHKTVRILILTYTNALIDYTRQLVQMTSVTPCLIELKSIDSMLYRCCRSLGIEKYELASDAEKTEYAKLALNTHMQNSTRKGHRFYQLEPQFWVDEFTWMMQKALWNKQDYIDAERTGRGTKVRITKEEKTIVFELFEIYNELLKKNGKKTWEQLYQFAWDNRNNIPEDYYYDYVLIDEAQDLSFVQLRFARYLTGETITVAADAAQKIYKKSFAWKDIGIDIRGQASKKLSVTFRNTKEIWALAESLQNVNRSYTDDRVEYTDSTIPTLTGVKPRVYVCRNAADENHLIASLAREWAFKGKVVGVLYRAYSEGKMIMNALRSESVPFEYYKDKNCNLAFPGVKVCTLHSSKGLEFDSVLIPHFTSTAIPLSSVLNSIADPDEKLEQLKIERSLLYVGMTRAKNELVLTFCGEPSPFLGEFDPKTYDYLKTDGTEVTKVPFTGVVK